MTEKTPENPMTKILETEAENLDSVHLYRVGAVYRAYERSAFYFTKRVKNYKVSKRLYKEIGREILYTGFYVNIWPGLLAELSSKNFSVIVISENHIQIKLSSVPNNYDRWQQEKLQFIDFENQKIALQKSLSPKNAPQQEKQNVNKHVAQLYRLLCAMGIQISKMTGAMHKNAKFAYGDSIRVLFIELLQHVYLVQRGVYEKVNVPAFREKMVRLQCILDFMNVAKIVPARPFFSIQKKITEIEGSFLLLN